MAPQILFLLLLLATLSCAGLLVYAQRRTRSRKMALLTYASVLGLCAIVWTFKDLERQHDSHYLLFDFGQIIQSIDELNAVKKDAEIRRAFKIANTREWWHHPDRQHISKLRESLTEVQADKPAQP